MKKVIQRTKGFEKAFVKLSSKWRQKFIKQLEIFLEDEFDARLKTHELQGARKGEWSFSLAYNIRAIYIKDTDKGKEVITFTFIDVGSHSKVY